MEQSRSQRPSPTDVAVAGGTLVAQVGLMTLAATGQPERDSLDALAYALLVPGPIALLWRRTYPLLVIPATVAFALVYWSLDYARGPVFLALAVAIVTAIVHGHRLAGWAWLAITYVGLTFAEVVVGREDTPDIPKLLAFAGWILALGAIGEGLRVREERLAERRRARAQEAQRQLGEERLRIARELHDVLAHNVSLINVQAGVGLHLLEQKPEQAESSLAAIKQASAETLRELRSVLGVLREDEHAPRAPAPSLARLDELAANADLAGLRVTTAVEGEPRPLPSGVDVAAFRILQEALTNVARHAPGAAANVRVSYGADMLELRVEDDGPGPANGGEPVAGNGVTGMRERVAALDGELELGTRPGGGFRVQARLPLAVAR